MIFIAFFQKIDLQDERILLAMKDNVESHALASKIPKDQARYHFFLFKHTHEGDYLQTIGNSQITDVSLYELLHGIIVICIDKDIV